VSLLAELGNNQFFSSDYFKSMSFGSPDIKKFLEKNGVDNQGSAIMSLYAMLVVPYELIRDNYADEFSEMNAFLAQKTINARTTYKDKVAESDFMCHIRNAIAHYSVSFKEGDSMVFTDSNGAKNEEKKKDFYGELLLVDINAFFERLQLLHLKVIRDIQARV